ncbi:MAG: alpha/beta hydrolase fold domain-containing protein [Bacteroidales bacterium]|nr:alpha/beta hydrolase fold domain-containing protein [Bacteroidales bacterium]
MRTKIFTFTLLLFVYITSVAQVAKSTFVYSIKDNDTLRLDRYSAISESDRSVKPCIVFMFGGGFVGGHRDWEGYLSYFKEMAEKGYVVFSIDYRLGLRPLLGRLQKGEKIAKAEYPLLFENTINVAVEDLYDATSFILSKADEWKIDPARIIINGSSAGAVSVLQAEYYLCSGNKRIRKLPDGFRYAGVISFAGAILSTSESLHWDKQPCPILFFHGDADNRVPYDKVSFFQYCFFGSKKLAEEFDKLKCPYYFYDVENAAHEIAESPMKSNIAEIEEFLSQFIDKQQLLAIHKRVRFIDKPVLNKKFCIDDYINANFNPSK